ncbi:hypothetical protein FPV67DRAFT_1117631 [Lyophyllum atratum]|nr:hypothetical protein FPV67DRAFT_1117631 [Lyophyllum atratum]
MAPRRRHDQCGMRSHACGQSVPSFRYPCVELCVFPVFVAVVIGSFSGIMGHSFLLQCSLHVLHRFERLIQSARPCLHHSQNGSLNYFHLKFSGTSAEGRHGVQYTARILNLPPQASSNVHWSVANANSSLLVSETRPKLEEGIASDPLSVTAPSRPSRSRTGSSVVSL